MKYIILLIILLLVLLSYNTYNEYYVNDGYITVYGQNGLNNKLNTLLGYLNVANKENKKLRFIWIENSACPGKFNDLFEDIPNLEIIYQDTEYDFKSYRAPNNHYVTDKYFNLLKPLPQIQDNINFYKKQLNDVYIACHIRRTDIVGSVWIKKVTTDEDYINFINQHDPLLKIFIATDNKETQDIFKNIYGDRIICKDIIPSNNRRQTSLQDAIVDMYVCVGSTYFLGYEGSSFSVSIQLIKDAKK